MPGQGHVPYQTSNFNVTILEFILGKSNISIDNFLNPHSNYLVTRINISQ